MATPNTGPRRVRGIWVVLAWLGLLPLFLYLAIVLPSDNPLPGVNKNYVGGGLVALAFLLTWGIIWRLRTSGEPKQAGRRLKKLAFLGAVTLFCILTLDVVGYIHLRPPELNVQAGRTTDEQVWEGELMPQRFYPTEANFFLYKPGVTSIGYSYGEFYYPDLLRHAVLRESVLQLRKNEFLIDQYGLRNTRPPEEARIFALGDSFCFGSHVTQAANWTELLASRLGQPVYNLGVRATSPLQQLLLLEYLLEKHPQSFQPRHLLWLIFGGNDLQDDHSPGRPESDQDRLFRTFSGTIIRPILSLPRQLRRESMIRRMADGDVTFNGMARNGQASDHYLLDGQRLAYPLYYSRRFGYKLFHPGYLANASLSESEVLNHLNRPTIERTFRRMSELSRLQGFDVTVVIVPSAAQLYKDYFEDFHPVSKEPHFANFLKGLCNEVGFAHLDLGEALAPYASQELFYQRDDTHWDERGHEIATDLIEENIRLVENTDTIEGSQSSPPAARLQRDAADGRIANSP